MPKTPNTMKKKLKETDFRTINTILKTDQYVPITMGNLLAIMDPITHAMDIIKASRPELKKSMTALHDRLLDYYQTGYLIADIFRGKLNLGTLTRIIHSHHALSSQ